MDVFLQDSLNYLYTLKLRQDGSVEQTVIYMMPNALHRHMYLDLSCIAKRFFATLVMTKVGS